MRALLVVNAAWDLPIHRIPVLRAMQQVGYTVSLAFPPGSGDPGPAFAGLDVHTFPLDRGGMNPARDLKTVRALTRIYRTLRPDLVHHFTSKPVAYGTWAAARAGVPLVVNSITGLGFSSARGQRRAKMASFAQGRLFRLAARYPGAHFVFQNQDDQEVMVRRARIPPPRTHLIRGSGVDTTRFTPTPWPAEPRVTFIGRIARQKGVLDYLNAVASLRATRATFDARLVGGIDEGNPSALDHATVQAASARADVQWTGWTDSPEAELAEASIVVLPSRGGEGVPMSLLEAAAAGRALVATNVPGCRDVVEDKVTGWLVPPGDVERLGEAIGEAVADPDEARRRGDAARERVVQEFSAAAVVDRFVALYQSLAGLR